MDKFYILIMLSRHSSRPNDLVKSDLSAYTFTAEVITEDNDILDPMNAIMLERVKPPGNSLRSIAQAVTDNSRIIPLRLYEMARHIMVFCKNSNGDHPKYECIELKARDDIDVQASIDSALYSYPPFITEGLK
jgi:hypothetical protein